MKRLLFLLLLLPGLVCGQVITTVAGTGSGAYTGDGGLAIVAGLGGIGDLAFDDSGNYYIGENNNTIRKVSVYNIITTVVGDGSSGYTSDGSHATSGSITSTGYVSLDHRGNLYFSEIGNNKIRKVNLSTGILSTVAGNGIAGFSGDGGRADTSQLNWPYGLCFDTFNNLYFADCQNYRIRKIDTNGIISTIAGMGIRGTSGDGGLATLAKIYAPYSVCVDRVGNIYFSDSNRIRKIATSTGIISAYAGNGGIGYSGDGGTALTALFRIVDGEIKFNTSGQLFINDEYNDRIRMVDTNGLIFTVAGNGSTSFSGDGGPATNASLYSPRGIAIDACGNLLIGDNGHARIRKVTFNPPSSTDTPTLSILPSVTGAICTGTSVTYTASHTHGGIYATYQWFVNTTAISGATDSFYTYAPANGDSVKCTIATWNRCSSVSYDTSDAVYMVVIPLVTLTISISVSPNDTVCAGTTATYTATTTGGGASGMCHWHVNGSMTAMGTSYSYTPATGDTVNCILASTATCVTASAVYSNVIHMVVNPVVTPTISISVSPNDTVCSGTAVTFIETAGGGATSVSYQWLVNGSVAGSSSTYTYTPAHGDSIRCLLTTSDPCATAATVSSTTVHMVVNPTVTPSITITPNPNDTICNANIVSFTSSVTDGGSSPTYQWKVNGINAGTGSTGYTYSPINGDSVRCELSSTAACTTPTTVSSNMVNMVVATIAHPVVAITGPPTAPVGSSVTITATVTGAGSSYVLHWFNQGTEFTTTTIPTVTYTKTLPIDTITARVVSNDFCYDSTLSGAYVVGGTASIPPAPFLQSKKGVTCYPNPVRNELHVSAGSALEHIVITNLIGQVVYTSNIINEREFVVPGEGFVCGVYFVKVGFGDGSVVVDRFVKE